MFDSVEAVTSNLGNCTKITAVPKYLATSLQIVFNTNNNACINSGGGDAMGSDATVVYIVVGVVLGVVIILAAVAMLVKPIRSKLFPNRDRAYHEFQKT